MNLLLTRDQFRERCLERDKNRCVICLCPDNLSVHHIQERRLFQGERELGGYFIFNGSSLCEPCHIRAEETTLSCEEIRNAIGIKQIILPEHLCPSEMYTKWGDIILPNGQRLPGELFHDESVQKILAQGNVLHLYTKYVKYPRTFHAPWSPGKNDDDKVLHDLSHFEGEKVIVTPKFDGENSTFYRDYYHARSINSDDHPSRHIIKSLHAKFCYDIPEGWRICGENLYAQHSISYRNLPSYLLIFSIWNEKNQCLSWEETKEWCSLLDLHLVPTIYEGIWDEKLIKNLSVKEFNGDPCEGYVVRIADGFSYKEFRHSVIKMVRAGHVTTNNHWKHGAVVPNQLK